MKKPNLFIPGFPKSGTSSLHTMLIQHSEISGGIRKEPHTYSWDNRYKNRFSFFNEVYKNLKTKYILESSTTYMVSGNALDRIMEDTPEAKFIIIARDPIDRIISHYNWLSNLGYVNKLFEDEIKKHSNEKFNYKKHYGGNYKAYIDFSKYGEHLERMFHKIPENQLFFLTFEDFINNWEMKMLELSNFLDIDLSEINIRKDNPTKPANDFDKIIKSKETKWIQKLKIDLVRKLKGKEKKIRGLKVKNPIINQVTRKDVQDFLYPILEEDFKKLKSLGFNVESWKTNKFFK